MNENATSEDVDEEALKSIGDIDRGKKLSSFKRI